MGISQPWEKSNMRRRPSGEVLLSWTHAQKPWADAPNAVLEAVLTLHWLSVNIFQNSLRETRGGAAAARHRSEGERGHSDQDQRRGQPAFPGAEHTSGWRGDWTQRDQSGGEGAPRGQALNCFWKLKRKVEDLGILLFGCPVWLVCLTLLSCRWKPTRTSTINWRRNCCTVEGNTTGYTGAWLETSSFV